MMKRVVLIPSGSEIPADCVKEFIRYWQAVSGEKLPVVHSPGSHRELIVFGSDAQNPFVHRLMLDGCLPDLTLRNGSDDYRLHSFRTGKQSGMLILGGNARAYFYAVYDFFERVCNCRYFWDGDRIPEKKTIPLDGLDVHEKPGFQYRGIRYFAHRGLHRFQAEHWDLADWKKEIDWVMKKRLNLFSIRTGIEDLFQKAFPDVVPNPRFGEQAPEWRRNSHFDRTPFWKLEYRGKMLRQVYDYARSRGLIAPTDCGTMTHWYNFTPPEFLDRFKPGFIPEQHRYKGRPEGKVWDIRKDVNMERYWKLSEAQLREYHTSEVFHTIGLAERRCFPDHERNHYFKRYAFRRIEDELRKHYPHAPLLVASWDFIATWSYEEVRDFIAGLDPENTILLDYTCDIYQETNNFLNWGVLGKFPWIYGIFHAYEASNEIRGNYDNISRRFPYAAADPMCKGMVFWPENSHADTLMLEYFSAMAWHRKYVPPETFIGEFCSARYTPAAARMMEGVWLAALPLIKASLWGEAGPMKGEPLREVYPSMYFQLLNRGSYCWSLGELDEERQELHRHTVKQLSPLLPAASQVLKSLSAVRNPDEFQFRDLIDLARTVTLRLLDYGLSAFALALERWQLEPSPETEKPLRGLIDSVTNLSRLLTRLISASEEFSLAYTLDRLKKVHPVNPAFEDSFIRNAVSPYCRSFYAEVAANCYEAEWQYIAGLAEQCLAEKDRRPWRGKLEVFEKKWLEINEAYYEHSLEEMRPDVAAARKGLAKTLSELSDTAAWIGKYEPPYRIF